MVLMRRQLEAQPKPVSLTRFPAYSDYLLGVPERISNEYCMLQTFSKDIAEAESCSVALQPENRRKNRYCNILPYDSTRVILDPLPDDPSSDYINPSFIRGYSREVEYIASQGPKEDTCFDFWRMVHQHGVKLIIMLTNLQESDRVKCHQYFPSQREHLVFGDITIRCTTELVFPIYTSRTLQLLRDNTQRSIVHLHFREWPDFGCPTNPDMLIHFAQAVRHQVTLMKPCLAVVHCSAGVGRTGTLITIDILLQHIKEHKKVDIFGTVFNLRRQRMFMVQCEPQYVHIYHCIKAALTDPKLMDSAHQIDAREQNRSGSDTSVRKQSPSGSEIAVRKQSPSGSEIAVRKQSPSGSEITVRKKQSPSGNEITAREQSPSGNEIIVREQNRYGSKGILSKPSPFGSKNILSKPSPFGSEMAVREQSRHGSEMAVREQSRHGSEMAVREQSPPGSDTAVRKQSPPGSEMTVRKQSPPGSEMTVRKQSPPGSEMTVRKQSPPGSEMTVRKQSRSGSNTAVRKKSRSGSNTAVRKQSRTASDTSGSSV